MTRIQFWILTCTVILISLLFLAEIYLSTQVHKDGRRVMIAEKVAEEGNGYQTRWQQLAVRTYQLSQRDSGLKNVLSLNHIDIKAQAPANSPAATPALTTPESSAMPDSSAMGPSEK